MTDYRLAFERELKRADELERIVRELTAKLEQAKTSTAAPAPPAAKGTR